MTHAERRLAFQCAQRGSLAGNVCRACSTPSTKEEAASTDHGPEEREDKARGPGAFGDAEKYRHDGHDARVPCGDVTDGARFHVARCGGVLFKCFDSVVARYRHGVKPIG